MNETEIDRLAAMANALRPDWPTASVKSLIARSLANRPRRDVAVALAWVACERETQTPARVLEAGPWWRAAGADDAVVLRPTPWGELCATCSRTEDICRRIYADDHPYVSNAARRPA